jgi:hypothetical protein
MYYHFEDIKPGEMFSIQEDDGTVRFCYKVLVGNGYHACLILNDSNFNIEFACPRMVVLK